MDKEERREREKEEAAQKRRQQILNAGKKLFAEKSPGEVTMSAIADECALSAATIYLYYESKEDLLFHIMTEYMVNFFDYFDYPPDLTGIESLKEFVSRLKADYLKDLPQKNLISHFDLYYEKEYPDLPSADVYKRTTRELNERLIFLIRKGQDDGTIRTDIDPRLYGCLIGNMFISFGLKTALRRELLHKNQKTDPFDEYCLILDLILDTIRIK